MRFFDQAPTARRVASSNSGVSNTGTLFQHLRYGLDDDSVSHEFWRRGKRLNAIMKRHAPNPKPILCRAEIPKRWELESRTSRWQASLRPVERVICQVISAAL